MIDGLIVEFDKALRTLFAAAPTARPRPGSQRLEAELSESERNHTAALMRVNHCGEVCAQALYQGQALTSRNASVRDAMETAAWEETEHLNWTEQRIAELGGRKSLFNPVWYLGALSIGLVAGAMGDAWNLGFLVETERQVERHLQGHLDRISSNDERTRAILEQMRADEIGHAKAALDAGAHELPLPVKAAMRLASKVMTQTAYYL
ncbi:MAG: 2-polyprenyl-3-methyl-6-methoxy-1,4-benzoquinone monooxygenase [Rhodocyclaceae bacterium]|jgi:ubiquinone biosynthesis monooxygenase Coq7|nr:2-polyprenyl-3-methyl-6-methoxy-1,4-benzoquinone monooxygenase [Rhodocyclaceae bacterium]